MILRFVSAVSFGTLAFMFKVPFLVAILMFAIVYGPAVMIGAQIFKEFEVAKELIGEKDDE